MGVYGSAVETSPDSLTKDQMSDTRLIQRRTVRVLMACVVPAGIGTSGGYAAAAVLAEDITGSGTLAGLAAAGYGLGAAIATLPLARFMSRHGRRGGLVRGWSLAAVGAGTGAVAAILSLYPLLVLGTLLLGAGNATTLTARYAAADLATENTRARAIGLLVWASAFGAVFGPTVGLGPAGRVAVSLGLPELAGPYLLSAIMLSGAGLLVSLYLRPDPLEVAGGIEPAGTVSRPRIAHSFARIWAHSGARLAVLAMLVGQVVMVAVMTMTPLHMKDGRQSLQVIGLMISFHIIGMYFFAPVVGWLVDRVGPRPLIALAGILLFIGGEVASRTDAADRAGVFWGLFLIGLGWSFGLIAGSSVLTASVPLVHRVEVQGAADLIMVGSGAFAGLTSGVVVELAGYRALSHWAGIGALVLVVAAVWQMAAVGRSRPVDARSEADAPQAI